jgi:ParB family chromosome partitioning protein
MVSGKSKLKQSLLTISIDLIDYDVQNIRKRVTDISGLKQTISDVGLLQPILLHKNGDRYVVIDGERRLRAMKDLEIKDLIVGRDVVIDVEETATDVRFKQVIANIQRDDINDVELGHAFILLNGFGYQNREIAEIIGKTPHYVTAKVGLAKRLSNEVQVLYVSDIEAVKCIPDTSSEEIAPEEHPYLISVNVVQSIARLPTELQMPSYEAIKAGKMDKNEALKYLQSIRKNIDEIADDTDEKENIGTNIKKEVKYNEITLKRYITRLNKDVDLLSTSVKTKGSGREEEVLPALETLIYKLQSLYSELKSGNVNAEVRMTTT